MAEAPLDEIVGLGRAWHAAGSMSDAALLAIARLAPKSVSHSAETGCGRSTFLFSHISEHHLAFALEDDAPIEGSDSIANTVSSPLLKSETTDFVFGPTQATVPAYHFEHPLDIVLLDGPHAFPYPILEYYYFYPHMRTGSVLIVDDVHIPSMKLFFDFLCKDHMWHLQEVTENTAFFTRTEAPTFDPMGDWWYLQGYNEQMYKDMSTPPPPPRFLWLRSHAPAWSKSLWRSMRNW